MRFLINVPDALHDALKSESKQRGQTLTGLVRGILWDWMQANGDRPTAPAEEHAKT